MSSVTANSSPLRALASPFIQLPSVNRTKSQPSGSLCSCSQGQQGTNHTVGICLPPSLSSLHPRAESPASSQGLGTWRGFRTLGPWSPVSDLCPSLAGPISLPHPWALTASLFTVLLTPERSLPGPCPTLASGSWVLPGSP